MATSTDGSTWKENKIGSGDLISVTYDNGVCVITEKNGYIDNSVDLNSWNRIKISATNLYSSAFGEGCFIVSSYGCMHCSSDGKNWEEVPFGDNSWEEVIFDGSVFWALENNGYLGKSADGVIWKSVGIKDNSGLKLSFLNGFCSHGQNFDIYIVKKQGDVTISPSYIYSQ